jgi:hypothetical protein
LDAGHVVRFGLVERVILSQNGFQRIHCGNVARPSRLGLAIFGGGLAGAAAHCLYSVSRMRADSTARHVAGSNQRAGHGPQRWFCIVRIGYSKWMGSMFRAQRQRVLLWSDWFCA